VSKPAWTLQVWWGVISRTSEANRAEPAAAGARSLLCAAAVRRTARRVLQLAVEDSLSDWIVHPDRLPAAADLVAQVVRERYPDLRVPFHARWRHFVLSGQDLWERIAGARVWNTPAERARAAFDLAITSVLLDAGAGADWRYTDVPTGLTAVRSEGLALASLRWFARGGLSGEPEDPLRADAVALRAIDAAAVDTAFQSGTENPLQGTAGRALLLNRLGVAVAARPDLFAIADTPRPGGLFDALAARAVGGHIAAATILEVLLEGLGTIWPNRPTLDGIALGDCWPYPDLSGDTSSERFVPLHKLSQWLAYSLIEPLEFAGIRVSDVGGLTGLAEYRNGGLFLDTEVLVPRDLHALARVHEVAEPLVVGWRALTVGLLDEIAPLVTARLGLTPQQFPLARVLEGGTWAAGRLIARKKRSDGGPPIRITSDGTVF
jgi:Protein of unknown function (DUF1688)